MNISDIYQHIPVHNASGWTIQRFGVMHNGKYRWRIFHNYRIVDITKRPVTVEVAMRTSREYVQKVTE